MSNLTVSLSPHVRAQSSTRRIMLDVLIALIPAVVFAVYWFGFSVLVTILLSMAAAIGSEALMQKALRRPITVDDGFTGRLYCAGVKRNDDNVPVTAGGRVLGVTDVGETLRQAIDKAYEQAAKVHFENAYCRKDIGQRALAAGEEK